MPKPRVFLSYSHESSDHEEWVLRLATHLAQNGVETTLDQWHLRLGDDLVAFMSEGIRKATHVILVCTDAFGTKATTREGGVGFEQTVLLGNLLLAAHPAPAIIPILRSGTPSVAIPAWLGSRLFADFHDEGSYETKLQELLRRLFDAEPRPPLVGSPAEPMHGTTAPEPPKAWILVTGTGKASLPEKLAETATALGERLANAGYGLVTGGWPGVDDLAARAFARRLEQTGAAVEDRLTQVIVDHAVPAFSAGNLILVKGHSEEEWTKLVGAADAVVVAGGIGGAAKTAEWGHKLGRPVFPLPDTGGDAAHLYLAALRTLEAEQTFGVSPAQFMTIAREAPRVVGELVKVLDAWHANRRAGRAGAR